jgi:hypothetical protein
MGPYCQDNAMAKPNYQFEKRQRDIAKKKKQDEKRSKKLTNKDEAPSEDAAAPESAVPGTVEPSAS